MLVHAVGTFPFFQDSKQTFYLELTMKFGRKKMNIKIKIKIYAFKRTLQQCSGMAGKRSIALELALLTLEEIEKALPIYRGRGSLLFLILKWVSPETE